MPSGKIRRAAVKVKRTIGKALWIASRKREKRHFTPAINAEGNVVIRLEQDIESGKLYIPATNKRYKLSKKNWLYIKRTPYSYGNRRVVHLVIKDRRAK
ncbi:MAG: hypothetical protein Q7S21_04960 [archaeon]|nr:hypothetical protein [archaeon]